MFRLLYNVDVKIYLIRHVATAYNLSGTYMGRSQDVSIDIPQARYLEAKLNSNITKFSSVHYIISSPLSRCLQTSELMIRVLGGGVKTVIENGFIETNMGAFEGKNMAQVKETYAKEYKLWLDASSDFVFPKGESYLQVQQRSYTALTDVVSRHSASEDLVIITHVDIIKMLLFKILNVSVTMKKYIHVDTGSISCIETYNDCYKIKFVNM
ncbi:MAG: hypothetical protein RLY61_579 [Candidatus Parcubacteria bacterium]